MQITEHFSINEVTFSSTAVRTGVINKLPEGLLPNAILQAQGMEQVRSLLGFPLHVDSWYRCLALNVIMRGAKESDHMLALATDFICPQFGSPRDICHAILKSDIKFGKIIMEGTWVHISFNPRWSQIREALTAVFAVGKPTTYVEGIA